MLDLNWRLSGNQYVAYVGNLSVSVCRRGSAARGDVRWRVREVFGNPFLGSGWTDLDSALAGAAGLATREALSLAALVVPLTRSEPKENDRHDPEAIRAGHRALAAPPQPGGPSVASSLAALDDEAKWRTALRDLLAVVDGNPGANETARAVAAARALASREPRVTAHVTPGPHQIREGVPFWVAATEGGPVYQQCGKVPGTLTASIHDALTFATRAECEEWIAANPAEVSFSAQEHLVLAPGTPTPSREPSPGTTPGPRDEILALARTCIDIDGPAGKLAKRVCDVLCAPAPASPGTPTEACFGWTCTACGSMSSGFAADTVIASLRQHAALMHRAPAPGTDARGEAPPTLKEAEQGEALTWIEQNVPDGVRLVALAFTETASMFDEPPAPSSASERPAPAMKPLPPPGICAGCGGPKPLDVGYCWPCHHALMRRIGMACAAPLCPEHGPAAPASERATGPEPKP